LLSRREAMSLVEAKVGDERRVKHVLAVETIMRGLAERLGGDPELWGLAGLLHDLDFTETRSDPKRHGLVAAELLKGRVPDEVVRAIAAHNYENTGVRPESAMERALIAADAVSGLLVACALVMPSRKLAEVTVRTVERKYRSKDFARGVDRQRIALCEQLGIPLTEFFELSLRALRAVADGLGL
jgi:putative nucleotidyltransferase with HDIG domain